MTEKEILRHLTFIKCHLNKIAEDKQRCEKYGHTLYLIPIIDSIELAQKAVKKIYKKTKNNNVQTPE